MIKKLLFYAALLLSQSLFAQGNEPETTPCTSKCIDPTKSQISTKNPSANGISPNVYIPCGSGYTEDNPFWFRIIPSGTQLSFQILATNCIGSSTLGVQMTLWEGEECGGPLTAIRCSVGLTGNFTQSVTPCKMYFLQIDGWGESVCNISLSYNKDQILTQVPKPEIKGPAVVCPGTKTSFSLSLPSVTKCNPALWKCTLTPANAGIVNSFSTKADITITNPNITEVELCAEPVFRFTPCAITTQKQCIKIKVAKFKPTTCDVALCPETLPFVYDLKKCIKTINSEINSMTIIPSEFIVTETDFPPGTLNKEKKIVFKEEISGCAGETVLKISVPKKDTIQLPTVELCGGETKIVRGESYSCSDAGTKYIVVKTTDKDKELGICDSTFTFKVNCQNLPGKMKSVKLKTTSNFKKPHFAVLDGKQSTTGNIVSSYVMHEGKAGTIVKPIVYNKTGVFYFDSTKMKCNRIYYISYVVGKAGANGIPDAALGCYAVTPQGQPVAWLCTPKITTQATIRNNNEDTDDIASSTDVNIFPNPADELFFVSIPKHQTLDIKLYDLQGKEVLNADLMNAISDNLYEVPVQNLQKGIYLLKIKLDDVIETKKVVIE